LIEAKTLLFGDPGCDDVEEIISNKNMESVVNQNNNANKSSDSEEEEDELAIIFDKVLTKQASTKKQESLELMENLEKKTEEEKVEEKKDEVDDKRLRLMKTKSFLIRPNDSALKVARNESKSKEN